MALTQAGATSTYDIVYLDVAAAFVAPRCAQRLEMSFSAVVVAAVVDSREET